MSLLGIIVMVVGLIGLAIQLLNFGTVIPGFLSIPLPPAGWGAIAVVGAIIAMLTRRARD